MKDEIKEILDYWQFYINEPNNYKLLNVHFDEVKKVLDYITNLQEENERLKVALKGTTHCYDEEEHKKLKEENERLRTVLNGSEEKRKKAIEYITNNKLYTFKYDDEELFEITTDKKAKDVLLKILGGDENDNQTNN